jgi:hypothetical protein
MVQGVQDEYIPFEQILHVIIADTYHHNYRCMTMYNLI